MSTPRRASLRCLACLSYARPAMATRSNASQRVRPDCSPRSGESVISSPPSQDACEQMRSDQGGARLAHNPKVAGSNPAPATAKAREIDTFERSGVSSLRGRARFPLVVALIRDGLSVGACTRHHDQRSAYPCNPPVRRRVGGCGRAGGGPRPASRVLMDPRPRPAPPLRSARISRPGGATCSTARWVARRPFTRRTR